MARGQRQRARPVTRIIRAPSGCRSRTPFRAPACRRCRTAKAARTNPLLAPPYKPSRGEGCSRNWQKRRRYAGHAGLQPMPRPGLSLGCFRRLACMPQRPVIQHPGVPEKRPLVRLAGLGLAKTLANEFLFEHAGSVKHGLDRTFAEPFSDGDPKAFL